MDRTNREEILNPQCSSNSEGTYSHDILWVRAKYKVDQIKINEIKSILIVDEKYLTETLQSILEDSNLNVDAVQSSAQALKMMISKYFDIVVIEANLLGPMGGKMTQIIKKISSDTKIILMVRDEYWNETLKDNNIEVDNVLLKPFAPE
jgi:DNA-binding response OmpR family regulator